MSIDIERIKRCMKENSEIMSAAALLNDNSSEALEKYLNIIKKQNELIKLILDIDVTAEYVPVEKRQVQFDSQGFYNYLDREGISKNSISTYITQVRLFFEKYVVMNNDTLSAYEKTFSKCAPKTAKLRIASMNKYFKFSEYTGYEFKTVKEQTVAFCDNVINEAQYRKILRWTFDNNKKVWLIIKVISSTGVRVSELIKMRTSDLFEGYADITGKGNKKRRVYFPKSLVREIKDACGEKYIVENRYGQQISARGISSLLQSVAEKADIPKEVMHPHSFRHFFAKRFIKEKNDITLLGDLLGHSNVSTTAIYTRLTSDEQLREINKIINW